MSLITAAPATQIAQFSSGLTDFLFWGIFSESLTHPTVFLVEEEGRNGIRRVSGILVILVHLVMF